MLNYYVGSLKFDNDLCLTLFLGNIDQVQYTDRMKEVVEFMAPKLTEEELTRIWQMADKASAHVIDNIHRIMAAATTRFNPHQFTHLLKLIREVELFIVFKILDITKLVDYCFYCHII